MAPLNANWTEKLERKPQPGVEEKAPQGQDIAVVQQIVAKAERAAKRLREAEE